MQRHNHSRDRERWKAQVRKVFVRKARNKVLLGITKIKISHCRNTAADLLLAYKKRNMENILYPLKATDKAVNIVFVCGVSEFKMNDTEVDVVREVLQQVATAGLEVFTTDDWGIDSIVRSVCNELNIPVSVVSGRNVSVLFRSNILRRVLHLEEFCDTGYARVYLTYKNEHIEEIMDNDPQSVVINLDNHKVNIGYALKIKRRPSKSVESARHPFVYYHSDFQKHMENMAQQEQVLRETIYTETLPYQDDNQNQNNSL